MKYIFLKNSPITYEYIFFQIVAIFTVFALASAKAAGPVPHHAPHHDIPIKYAYEYKVHDDYAGTDFGQLEARDGYATRGEYHVLLPDGRLQTVTYHVDDAYSGYIADVKYTGTLHPHPKAHHAPIPHHI